MITGHFLVAIRSLREEKLSEVHRRLEQGEFNKALVALGGEVALEQLLRRLEATDFGHARAERYASDKAFRRWVNSGGRGPEPEPEVKPEPVRKPAASVPVLRSKNVIDKLHKESVNE